MREREQESESESERERGRGIKSSRSSVYVVDIVDSSVKMSEPVEESNTEREPPRAKVVQFISAHLFSFSSLLLAQCLSSISLHRRANEVLYIFFLSRQNHVLSDQ